MRRRDFIKGIAGSTVARPFATQAQQPHAVKRVGVLMATERNDSEGQYRVGALEKGLKDLGWLPGHNLQLDYRWAGANIERIRILAKELVELQPDVIIGHNTPHVAALLRETQTIPIVFVVVTDPVGSGFVTSIARPGGNATGFTDLEPSLGGKWPELLKEVAPGTKRIAPMYNPETAPNRGSFYLQSFKSVASPLAFTPVEALVRDPNEIESTIAMLGNDPGSGFVVMPENFTLVHRQQIIESAADHRVPAVYPYRYFADIGGLISYGVDPPDIFRRSAAYVDKILKGEKPSDLPVQAPTKFELAINLKTARTLGLTVPESLLTTADKVIE